MARLSGRIALITGGASGFGEAIAAAFAREGAAVMIADINSEGAAEVAAALVAAGADAASVSADVTSSSDMEAAVAKTEAAFGGLSALIANAGIGQRPRRASETPVDLMRRQFEVNAIGAAVSAQAALPALRRSQAGASILFTLSGLALQPRQEFSAYGMAKAAGAHLMKTLAQDLAPEGIRVNGLFPAVSATPMFAEFTDGDESKLAAFTAAMPLGRMVTPNDVAAAAVYLTSPDEAGAITGCALPIDAGRSN
ncbi:MAG: glucose 1-dehydrogenase [Pseudomonadota bacterium]